MLEEDEVPDFNTCGRLLDTFGHQCSMEDCEEFRTVGIEVAAIVDDEPEFRIYPLCEEHLFEFISETIFRRQIQGLVDYDGNIKEVMDQEDPTP